ncbi:MAG TPA: hypothetical protein VJN93_02195 [Candidatus Acidoferrum sp.]|nr:hypothetical protein [Candidatus Acidoferrum sp.]
MDHNEAVRLHAAEKYLLGELPKAQREEYEEHYFDCPSCAEELKATVTFMESGRQAVRERVPEAVGQKQVGPAGWLAWFRPAIAVPVFAALLLVIGYQNGITIPSLRKAEAPKAVAEVTNSFSLMAVGSRGDGNSSLTISVRPQEAFGLDVDMPGNSPTGYICELQSSSGSHLSTLPVSAEAAKRSVHINIPAGFLQPGEYRLAIYTASSSGSRPEAAGPASVKPFAVEFRP